MHLQLDQHDAWIDQQDVCCDPNTVSWPTHGYTFGTFFYFFRISQKKMSLCKKGSFIIQHGMSTDCVTLYFTFLELLLQINEMIVRLQTFWTVDKMMTRLNVPIKTLAGTNTACYRFTQLQFTRFVTTQIDKEKNIMYYI